MSTQGKFAPITNPNMDPPKISHTQDLDEIKDKIISLQNDFEGKIDKWKTWRVARLGSGDCRFVCL